MGYKSVLTLNFLFLLNFTCIAQVGKPGLHPISYSYLTIKGELGRRLERNYGRLESERYTLEKSFPSIDKLTDESWPGDMEGRIMLGLVMDARAIHKESKRLTEMISILPQRLNKDGYFGPIEKDTILEQQLSGNGWFLRALCEYYEWKKDPKIKGYIKKVINNLALPTAGYHAIYPIDPADRRKNVGAASGTTQGTMGKWKLSSDIGCDFIFLDGIVHAYTIMPSPPLKKLIVEMINRFLQMDLKATSAQTHASLTALRGMLRYYSIVKDSNLLVQIKDRYRLYRTNAMTANFENFNWFGRPEWTEPCGIVDSYMVAIQLWLLTGNSLYLEDAHHIYYNGLANTQRSNGGFGLSNCPVPNHNSLKVIENEAWWCCTMRGAEGLATAVQYSYFINNRELYIPFYNTSIATLNFQNGSLLLKQASKYPFQGKVSFEVINSTLKSTTTMKIVAPSWTINHKLTINNNLMHFKIDHGFLVFKTKLLKGDKIKLSFDQITKALPIVNREYELPYFYTLNYGPLLLGFNTTKQAEIFFEKKPNLMRVSSSEWLVKGTTIRLSPVYHLMNPEVNKESGISKQILFKIGSKDNL